MSFIKKATWGNADTFIDATETGKSFTSHTYITYKLFDIDPCPGIEKQFKVEYLDGTIDIVNEYEYYNEKPKYMALAFNIPHAIVPKYIPPRNHKIVQSVRVYHDPKFNIIPIYKSDFSLQLNIRKLDCKITYHPIVIEIEDIETNKRISFTCSKETEYVDVPFQLIPYIETNTTIPKNIIQTRQSSIVTLEAYKAIQIKPKPGVPSAKSVTVRFENFMK